MCAMELKMVPDSGHHYFFIPMLFADGNARRRENALAAMPDSDPRKPWLECGWRQAEFYETINSIAQGDKDPWHNCDWEGGLNWVRYRLGYQDVFNKGRMPKLLGLWLAMESNVGDFSRGNIESQSEPSEAENIRFAEQGAQNSPNPYVFTQLDVNGLEKEEPLDFRPHFKAIIEHILLDKDKSGSLKMDWGTLPELNVVWIPAKGNVINVDLIIDFGNTRSAVLSLVSDASKKFGAGSTGSILSALTFTDENDQFWDAPLESNGLVDSFFALREPMFHQFHELATVYDIKKVFKEEGMFWNKRTVESQVIRKILSIHPQKFVQISPAVIGPAIDDVLNSPRNQEGIEDGGSYIQSSPKRYYWDNDEYGYGGTAWWNMFDRPWSKGTHLRGLQGELLAFCPMDGSNWDLDNPPTKWPREKWPTRQPGQAKYPRSDTMTWMALAILESAYRQLNSPKFNSDNMPYIPRRFNGIYLTYPSGWTAEEKEKFRSKWQKAMNIFYLTHLSSDAACPKVVLEVDEAVASQLPYVFSEIENLEGREYGRKASELWLSQVGRLDDNGIPHARIMTMDIGGGTADTSIIEYTELNMDTKNPLKHMKAELLFKDSECTAGDMLVKRIIEKVLLPSIASGDNNVLLRWNSGQKQGNISRKQLIIRQVLVPIVRFWMGRMSSDLENPFVSESGFCFTPQEMKIEDGNWKQLMDLLKLNLDTSTPILVTRDQIDDCIKEVFGGDFVHKMSMIAVAFGVDVVVICGKVSELPALKEIFKRYLPLCSDKLVFMKDYYAGNWYPAVYSEGGRIQDPKTATVSGAALFHAFTQSMVTGWQLEYDDTKFNGRNNWRWMNANDNFLRRDSNEDEVTMEGILVGGIICRSQFNTSFSTEPVYMLRLKDWHTKKGSCTLDTLTLRRVSVDNVERLELVDADGTFHRDNGADEHVTTSDIELVLHPMSEELNWQESTHLDF